jgi:Caspase domain
VRLAGLIPHSAGHLPRPRAYTTLIAVVATVLLAGTAAAAPVQRFTLVIGANAAGADRPVLRYAFSDAERFARVLVELGGVSRANEIVLKQPTLQDVVAAFDLLESRVAEARRAGSAAGRTEVLVYYSGHADEQGLLLGDDRYSYRALRTRLDRIPSDVRIAVLDACASGAFTRIKSGRSRPAFLVDESADMRGHAFLTSSAATEAAQESDRIRASFFTHYLVSGFRGAADSSGDGKVTLNEAYQFAFNETLGRTVDTRSGPQHPSYDINLSGTGDVVMTDVRQTSATLVLPKELEGRFFVRNSAHELVAELYKPLGREIELGVEPGTYEVRAEIQKSSRLAKAQVAEGGRLMLEARQFGPTAVEATRRRGGADVPDYAVAGRNRVELRFGVWSVGETFETVAAGVNASDLVAGAQYTRYVDERLALTFAVEAAGAQAGAEIAPEGIFAGTSELVAFRVGARWNPWGTRRPGDAIKPFIASSIGPVLGESSGSSIQRGYLSAGTRAEAAVGGHIGGGVDFHVARWLSVGVNGGYNWMLDFAEPIGVRDNYSGPQFGLNVGWLFGRTRIN